jgi:putative phage-type endonuclease
MKIINVEQGSPEWRAWRKTVITATDCPCIMGSNPWTSATKCLQKKMGLIDEEPSNAAMERGKLLEPIAREQFIKEWGINMTPLVVESTVHDFLGASLDGISDNGEYIIEIKCGGEKLYNMAMNSEIPNYYMDQMQHQLLITGCRKCFYYVFNGEKGVCLEVLPDFTFKDRFLPKAREFWKALAFDEVPEVKEYMEMGQDALWQEYSRLYRELDENIKRLEKQKEEIRNKLIGLCDDKNCAGNGIKIIKTETKGKICYENVPALKTIDLDKYRKPSTFSWRISIEDL